MTDFKKELNEKGIVVYSIRGVSMLPLLRQEKDIVVIRSKKKDFSVNDSVLFVRKNGQYVLHRIRKVLDDNKYFIIGDNCLSGEIVSEDQIIGILSDVSRGGKNISVKSFKYRLYVAYVPIRRFFIIHIYFLHRVYRYFKRKVRSLLCLQKNNQN